MSKPKNCMYDEFARQQQTQWQINQNLQWKWIQLMSAQYEFLEHYFCQTYICRIIDLLKYITSITLFLLRPGTTQYLDEEANTI